MGCLRAIHSLTSIVSDYANVSEGETVDGGGVPSASYDQEVLFRIHDSDFRRLNSLP